MLYQLEGKRLVSLYPADKLRLEGVLRAKLAVYGYVVPSPRAPASASDGDSAQF